MFLQKLISGKFTRDNSLRVARLKLSCYQDIICAVSHGKIKTPKSILFPRIIKMLTNFTELINITNWFGHGVSYTITEELDTENAFLKIDKNSEGDGIVLPDGCQKDVFTIVVADNIDCMEETLSGNVHHRLKTAYHFILSGGIYYTFYWMVVLLIS